MSLGIPSLTPLAKIGLIVFKSSEVCMRRRVVSYTTKPMHAKTSADALAHMMLRGEGTGDFESSKHTIWMGMGMALVMGICDCDGDSVVAME